MAVKTYTPKNIDLDDTTTDVASLPGSPTAGLLYRLTSDNNRLFTYIGSPLNRWEEVEAGVTIGDMTEDASPGSTDFVETLSTVSKKAQLSALPGGSGGSGAVSSVFGRTGAVLADANDYSSFYPSITHDHDTDYAPLSHNHAGVYALFNHDHNTDYASLSHNHAGVYAPLSHDHDADYVQPDEVTSYSKNHYLAASAVAHSSSHTIDLDDNPAPTITVAGNTTIDLAAASMRQGAAHVFTVLMDGTGGHTVTFNGTRFDGGVTIDNAADARTVVVFVIDNGVALLRVYEAA